MEKKRRKHKTLLSKQASKSLDYKAKKKLGRKLRKMIAENQDEKLKKTVNEKFWENMTKKKKLVKNDLQKLQLLSEQKDLKTLTTKRKNIEKYLLSGGFEDSKVSFFETIKEIDQVTQNLKRIARIIDNQDLVKKIKSIHKSNLSNIALNSTLNSLSLENKFEKQILQVEKINETLNKQKKKNDRIYNKLKEEKNKFEEEKKGFVKVEKLIDFFKLTLKVIGKLKKKFIQNKRIQEEDVLFFFSIEEKIDKLVQPIKNTVFFERFMLESIDYFTRIAQEVRKMKEKLNESDKINPLQKAKTPSPLTRKQKEEKMKIFDTDKINLSKKKSNYSNLVSLFQRFPAMITSHQFFLGLLKQKEDQEKLLNELFKKSDKSRIIIETNRFTEILANIKEQVKMLMKNQKFTEGYIFFSKIFYDEKLNYLNLLEVFEEFEKFEIADIEQRNQFCLQLFYLKPEIEEIRKKILQIEPNKVSGIVAKGKILTKDKKIIRIEDSIKSLFSQVDQIQKKIKGHNLFFFNELVKEILADYYVLEVEYKIHVQYPTQLGEIKQLISKKDEFNANVKIQFTADRVDIKEDCEKLEEVVEVLFQKMYNLKEELSKLSIRTPAEIELSKIFNFVYFSKKTLKKKKNIFGKSKSYIVYFGEVKKIINKTTNKQMTVKSGVGKEFHENGVISFYGKFANNQKNGMGCQYNRNGEIIVEGEWRNDKLFRKKISSIKLRYIDLKKIIGSLNYTKDVVGSGGYGDVWKIEMDGEICACKILHRNKTERKDFLQECKILSSLSHKNIVRFIGFGENPNGFVTEFCEGGSIAEKIRGKRKLSFGKKIRIMYQVIKGMNYLHKCRLIHRDLKWDNVLLKDKRVKIIDFGLSKTISSYRLSQKNTKKIGTSFYMAPEVIRNGENYSYGADMFSFGIMLYELLFNTMNPYDLDINSYYYPIEFKVSENPSFRPKIRKEQKNVMNEWVIDIMKSAWQADSSDRPTFDDLEKIFREKIRNLAFLRKKEKEENNLQKKITSH